MVCLRAAVIRRLAAGVQSASSKRRNLKPAARLAKTLSFGRLGEQARGLAGELAALHEQLPTAAAELAPQDGRAYPRQQGGAHARGDRCGRQVALFTRDDDARPQRAQGARVELRQLFRQARQSFIVVVRGEEFNLRLNRAYAA